MRLRMHLPLIVNWSTGCVSGESGPVSIASSQGRSRPRLCRCALKSAGVLSVGIRVSLRASFMFEEKKFFTLSFASDQQAQFAGVVIAPHGAFAVGNGLAFVDLIPAICA